MPPTGIRLNLIWSLFSGRLIIHRRIREVGACALSFFVFCAFFFSFFGLKYGSKSILHPPPPPSSLPPPRLPATCTADTCRWHRSVPSKDSQFSCTAAACALPPPSTVFFSCLPPSPFFSPELLVDFLQMKKIIAP